MLKKTSDIDFNLPVVGERNLEVVSEPSVQLQAPEPTRGEMHLMQRKRLTDRHQRVLNKILKENSHKEKYWILGLVDTKRKSGRTTIKPVMQVHDVEPPLQKEAYLYEVDNTLGTRQLVWVMHPNDKLSMPTIGKSISVAGSRAQNDLAAEVRA